MQHRRRLVWAGLLVFACTLIGALPGATYGATTGNPILPGYNADPSVELFEGRYYIYATGDERYFHAWTSTDLTNWIDAGIVLDRATVSWASNDTRTWAPDMVYRNGKYYFYYALAIQVGVAVCDSPVGPCYDKGSPLVSAFDGGAEAIDPMVFIDDNGQAYLYYGGSAGGGRLGTYKLNGDMTSLNGGLSIQFPTNFTEGAFVFKRNGTYYLTYSNGAWYNGSYNVQYATASSPLGPWNYQGTILSSGGAYQGPGHHSLLQYPGTDDWYIVYHRYQNNDFSTRYTAIDRMYFNGNGTIQPVTMTSSGVESLLAPGVNIPKRYEAENAVINHAVTRGACCGASNGKAAAYIDYSDSYVEFNHVWVPKAGTYGLTIRFGNGMGANSTHNVSVNGQSAGNVVYPHTGWDNWTSVTKQVSLNAGNNVIRLSKGDLYAELDYVELLRYEAEDATVNHAVVVSNNGASGHKKVGYIDYSDSYVEFTVNVPNAGAYTMRVPHSTGLGAATHNVSVNGGASFALNYPSDGWDNWTTVTTSVNLNAGVNTIRFSKGTSYTELDYIEVYK